MTSIYEDPSTWRQKTPSGIPYRTISRTGTFGWEAADAQETFLVTSNRLLDFAIEFFPPPILFGETIVVIPPMRMGGLETLHASTMTWKAHVDGVPVDPFGADPDAPDGTYKDVVELTVTYKTNKTNDTEESDPNDPSTFLEISSNTSGSFINSTAPNGKWSDTPEEAGEVNRDAQIPVTIIAPETEWNLRWPRIPFKTFNTKIIGRLRLAIGRVNSDVFKPLYNAPAETLLFIGYNFKEELTWRDGFIGTPPISLEIKFLEKNIQYNGKTRGHNDFWKAGEGWQYLKVDGTNPVYESTSFANIFAV